MSALRYRESVLVGRGLLLAGTTFTTPVTVGDERYEPRPSRNSSDVQMWAGSGLSLPWRPPALARPTSDRPQQQRGRTMHVSANVTMEPGDTPTIHEYLTAKHPFVDIRFGDVTVTTTSVREASALVSAAQAALDVWVLADLEVPA